VWSPVQQELRVYEEEMAPLLGVSVEGAASPREAVEDADLVVTVTPSRAPLIEGGWLKEGVTVLAVGADGPDKQELSTGIMEEAGKVVVDSRDQCLRLGETHHAVEAGVLAADEIHAELGEVLLGRKVGREGMETIVVDLTGVGAQDAAIAGAVWKKLGVS
jgi:ornithine cyclodeaminase/alanine dehydrogenase-like protein (mu-crystallin family)